MRWQIIQMKIYNPIKNDLDENKDEIESLNGNNFCIDENLNCEQDDNDIFLLLKFYLSQSE